MTFSIRACRRVLAAAAVALSGMLAAPGCASTAAARAPAPGGPALPAEGGPAPPDGAPAAVEAAWEELRTGAAVSAEALDGSAEGLALAGFDSLRRGDLRGAAEAFEAALEARRGLAAAAYGMGLVALGQGRQDVAEPWFAAALEADPRLARAELQLRQLWLASAQLDLAAGELAEQAGELDAAAGAYEGAIAGAGDVAALYLRLAAVERRRSGREAELAVLERGRRRAGDVPALLRELIDGYGAAERHREAYEAARALQQLLPEDADLAELVDDARRRFEEASLPPEYRELGGAPAIVREELAAILAIELEGLSPRQIERGVIVSDVGERWSAPFVQRMVAWDVLDVYQNNAFWPELQVTRSMLVEAAYRVLEALGLAESAPRPPIQDPPPEHLLFRPTQALVGLAIIDSAANGSVDLLEPVTGQEAISTVRRLAAAIRRLTR